MAVSGSQADDDESNGLGIYRLKFAEPIAHCICLQGRPSEFKAVLVAVKRWDPACELDV